MRINHEYLMLFGFVALNFVLLIYCANTLSVSYNEALIFFGQSSFLRQYGFLHEIINGANFAFSAFLGRDLAIRIPFLLAHFINIFLIYKISKKILPNRNERLISACIYMFLPGVFTSAIIINSAVFIIMFSLIALFLVQNSHFKTLFVLLIGTIFVSQAFMALYLAIFFYGIYIRKRALCLLGAVFAFAWLFIFDIDFSGKPKGYIIDAMAIFGATFSPLIFIYFIYAFYRILIKEYKDFLWFVSVSAFCFCLLLSVRAKPPFELFLPFCVIFIPHMVRLFFSSYKVHLPAFRTKYKLLAFALISTLALNVSASIFSDFLYAFLKSPKSHFAYKQHIAKELATELKKRGIHEIYSEAKIQKRLEFYEISNGGKYILQDFTCLNGTFDEIEIKKFSKNIAKFYICE